MDKGQRSSRLPSEGVTLSGECHSCAIAQSVAGDRTRSATGAYVVEDVGEDVVVISGYELDGLVVVPRQHIGGLEELSDLARAHILAALRRATQSVRDGNPGSVTRVVVMHGPPASEGHVCFHVLPNGSEDPGSSTPRHA